MAGNNSSNGKRSVRSSITREIERLKEKVKDLTLKLEREAKARELNTRLAAGVKKASVQLKAQITALSEQGRRLASQLKSTLGDASKRHRMHQDAVAKIAELKAKLSHKTAQLKSKGRELSRLALDSAHRTTSIMRSADEAAPPLSDAKREEAPGPAEPDSKEHPNDVPKLT
jgi:chromosome segregation ATPase